MSLLLFWPAARVQNRSRWGISAVTSELSSGGGLGVGGDGEECNQWATREGDYLLQSRRPSLVWMLSSRDLWVVVVVMEMRLLFYSGSRVVHFQLNGNGRKMQRENLHHLLTPQFFSLLMSTRGLEDFSPLQSLRNEIIIEFIYFISGNESSCLFLCQ